jgi:hypothetical protein
VWGLLNDRPRAAFLRHLAPWVCARLLEGGLAREVTPEKALEVLPRQEEHRFWRLTTANGVRSLRLHR